MSIAAIRLEVTRCLAQAVEHVRDAERALAGVDGAAAVRAAGDLDFYRQQAAAFAARLKELEACRETSGGSFVQGLRAEWLVQKQLFEEWSHKQKA